MAEPPYVNTRSHTDEDVEALLLKLRAFPNQSISAGDRVVASEAIDVFRRYASVVEVAREMCEEGVAPPRLADRVAYLLREKAARPDAAPAIQRPRKGRTRTFK